MTAEEYLAFERASSRKHQYVAGEVFAMAGASPRHNAIVGELIVRVGQAVSGGPCRVFPSDLKIYVPSFDTFTYPDVSVVCGALELHPGTSDVVTNPKVLFEVLSDTTERHDRGDKAEGYRTIPSVADHLLFAQHRVHVEHFARQPDGSWLLREAGPGGRVTLASVPLVLDVDALYAGVFDLPA